MPGGKRTDRVSGRDLQVLGLVARFGMIPRQVVALWAGTGRAVTLARERRLREACLLEVLPGVGDSGRLLLCTREGLRALSRDDLPVPRFSAGRVAHSAAAARVAVELERRGRQLLSEPEIFARERAQGERVFSAQDRPGHFHRPDLIILGDRIEAIEVELTTKGASRLDALLRNWRGAMLQRKVGGVRYLCSPQALPYVRRAVERTRTGELIVVEGLRDQSTTARRT
ncbi:MAG: hypothetical protein WB507_06420 [Solirubrobacterales bacterium]